MLRAKASLTCPRRGPGKSCRYRGRRRPPLPASCRCSSPSGSGSGHLLGMVQGPARSLLNGGNRQGKGTGRTGHDRTGQDRTGQDRTGQDRAGQGRTGQDTTGQERTGQDRKGQDMTWQGEIGQDRTGQDNHDRTRQRRQPVNARTARGSRDLGRMHDPPRQTTARIYDTPTKERAPTLAVRQCWG